ncbi:MAG TPA: TadE family protein [Dehalococcoidia bacterium]|nr:TadE family protein [Dehalococcoidia bacterium]
MAYATPDRERPSREGGQSLVEFALVLPVLLIVVFGIIDFAMGMRSYVALANATREGARYAAIGAVFGTQADCGVTDTTVVGRVCKTAEGLNKTRLTVVTDPTKVYPNGMAPGNSVVVKATYEYRFITPLGAIVDFFSAGSVGTSITLTSETDMRLE